VGDRRMRKGENRATGIYLGMTKQSRAWTPPGPGDLLLSRLFFVLEKKSSAAAAAEMPNPSRLFFLFLVCLSNSNSAPSEQNRHESGREEGTRT
jgi:hypothetical protein